MLKRLIIQNYALIADADISFEEGMTVITGETGAGKSILLGALSLILGARADRSHFKDNTIKCSVEGHFQLDAYDLKQLFDDEDLDYYPDTIIRREVTPQGKSRIFVNDTPSTLEVVKQIGERLIDIHSQHQSLLVNQEDFQLACLDALAKNQNLLAQYKEHFQEAFACKKEIEALKHRQQTAKADEDYLQFQISELEALKYQAGELSSLEQELDRLNNAEELLKNYTALNQILEEEEFSVLNNLHAARGYIKKLVQIDPNLEAIASRIESTVIELADIKDELLRSSERVILDPSYQEKVEDRINEINRLQQKHRLSEPDDLILLLESLSNEKINAENIEDQINALSEKLAILDAKVLEKANGLSKNRAEVVPSLVDQIERTLKELGMPHSKLSIELVKRSLDENGQDDIGFYFSANKGVEPQAIQKVASGGEISRLMLSIKNLLAEHQNLGTLLFDEIDTGISGEVANKMGSILTAMAQNRQVVCITHIPQVAAKGQNHLLVYKTEEAEITQTKIKNLNREERIIELAKMLSGKEMTEAAMNNAEELFNSN